MEMDTDWVDDDQMPAELQAKILALKVCRNRCLALAGSDTALEIVQPVVRMFSTLLKNEGRFSEDAKDTYVLLLRMSYVEV